MLKSLRVPERLFSIAMWAVSLAFAGFLVGLGGRLIADLPGVSRSLTREQFMDQSAVRATKFKRDSLNDVQRDASAEQDRVRLIAVSTDKAYKSARVEFEAWIVARTATTDPKQDPEVLKRTRLLDTLGASARSAEREIETLDARLLAVTQALENETLVEQNRIRAVESQFQRALFEQELKVFGLRLALTLPLLVGAAWLIRRKRKSEYWPLARGFVLFALFAFFVELVPYLPSYGGYVRYVVGIVLTLIAAREAVRAMKRYLAKRKDIEQQSEVERRRALGFETALVRMKNNVCPACERPIAGAPATPSSFCVYCGLHLYDECGNCHTRKNAFYQFCPTCGVTTEARDAATVAATTPPVIYAN